MTWFNQFFPSLGSYEGIVKFGVGLIVWRRLIMSGETPCAMFGGEMWFGTDGATYRDEGCGFDVGGADGCTIVGGWVVVCGISGSAVW